MNKIADMTNARTARDYALCVRFDAPRERVFDALTTLDGLRGWWTTDASGVPGSGGEMRFGFGEVDEFVMRVDSTSRPSSVLWSCTARRRGEWIGTQVMFDLFDPSSQKCELWFRHAGLTPKLECYSDCKLGWDHFLESLRAYVETGKGSPFQA